MHPSPVESPTAAAPSASPPPSTPVAAFVFAWAVFWALLVTVAVQDRLRQGFTDLWKPLLWEGTSCIVASAIVWAQWRQVPRLDPLLRQPWRWAAVGLARLPFIALAFVAAVYALRHGVYAALGERYLHQPWGQVLVYESVKFAVFYLLFMAVFFGIRSYAGMNAERLRAEREQGLAHQAQLLQLAQQIEPHFLFNALNTIAATIHSNPDLADQLLTRLATLLRAATDIARRPQVALQEELRLLDSYASIMCQRFADRVTLVFDVDPAALACRVPALSLQPLLENVFRHGVERKIGPAHIVVRVRRDGARLCVEVEDNIGELPALPELGVGLSNLQRRLALSHGEKASLSLTPRAGGGVVARIELPCEHGQAAAEAKT